MRKGTSESNLYKEVAGGQASDKTYDVAIVGTGIGGCVIGTILARQGFHVLMLEAGVHPRFAIGESTIPETTLMLRMMAKRYDVPELRNLSTFNDVVAKVSSQCGVKRNFSFVYHRKGEENRPRESTQLQTWAPPFGPDNHLFRQDVDQYLLNVAIRYGADVLQQTKVTDVKIDDQGVSLDTAVGKKFRARFVIDAGGRVTPLSRMLNLRHEEAQYQTNTRGMFTHMVGLKPFDEVAPEGYEEGLRSPISEGTLHHIFENGWMWVIPFNNHVAATNPLVSVGLCLDVNKKPYDPSLSPEKEFWEFISDYPTVARQFEGARATRNWVGASRMQFSSKTVVGYRYALMPHAAAFIDPLYSSGLAVSMSAVNNLAHRLTSALKDDDFSEERFEYVDTWVMKALAYYDRLVRGSYISFADFDLWNAWHRIWMLGSFYGVGGLMELVMRYEGIEDASERDRLVNSHFETKPYRGVHSFDFDDYNRLFDSFYADIEAFDRGESSAKEATSKLYTHLRNSEIVPTPWQLHDPANRSPGGLTLHRALKVLYWGGRSAPTYVRDNYFKSRPSFALLKDIWLNYREIGNHLDGGSRRFLRDSLLAWNRDWLRFTG